MEDFINEIKKDKEVSKFASTLTNEEIEMNLCMLLSQVRANRICNNCKGKKECMSDVYGMQSYLVKDTSLVSREYCDCNYLKPKAEDGLDILYFPEQMELGEVYGNINRKDILTTIQDYKKSDGTKGIYLYGPFGTGKTFIMLNFAKYLAEKGKKVIFAYYPELVRKVKSAIADNSLEKIIVKLKNMDVLMLDDIGGELNSSFIRDEFLGPILQYRMMAALPVFMTSNYNINDLRSHLASTKDENNPVKAARIIERIEYMMKPVALNDENYRR